MIRINLLPVKAAQKKVQLRNQLIVLVVTILLMSGGCFTVYSSIQSDIDGVKNEISRNKKEINKLKKKIGKVNKFKKLQAELKSKLEVLASLKAAKSGPVHLMDDLISALPEKLWITNFKAKGSGISLKGVGLSEDDVADFMTNLENSPYYQKIVLKVTKQKSQSGLKLQKFDLKCQVEKQKTAKKTGE
ncbi:MAG: PilN domain-containing protein [Thermodesulfobacteriota bacterium]|nr:PilN domain-containing protein [Thermodesulfobacteriota bacterium]